MTIGEAIGAAVRLERKRLGLSQRQLAKLAGMYHPNLRRLERGDHTPKLDVIARVARAMGKRPTELVAVIDEL